MSRTSRVPYHQNVYDLLQIEPSECPTAARMIAEHEARHGPLPASVREWYLVPNVVPLGQDQTQPYQEEVPSLWRRFSGGLLPMSLADVLSEGRWDATSYSPFAVFVRDNPGTTQWCLRGDGSDPPVWLVRFDELPPTWKRVSGSFSSFLVLWIVGHYPTSEPRISSRAGSQQQYRNGLWLRTPDEPFAMPILDFLTEQFGEPERIARPGDVTTHTYRPEGGTIRVTADAPAHPDPLSAWWVHADTPERLAEFTRLLLPWGTLNETLRADTDPARDVLHRIRTGAPN